MVEADEEFEYVDVWRIEGTHAHPNSDGIPKTVAMKIEMEEE
jgi:hypothetical protein